MRCVTLSGASGADTDAIGVLSTRSPIGRNNRTRGPSGASPQVNAGRRDRTDTSHALNQWTIRRWCIDLSVATRSCRATAERARFLFHCPKGFPLTSWARPVVFGRGHEYIRNHATGLRFPGRSSRRTCPPPARPDRRPTSFGVSMRGLIGFKRYWKASWCIRGPWRLRHDGI